MPARRAPSRPGCESSTTRQSRGARSGSRTRSRSSAWRKPSGEGLPALTSSALTIAAKQSARPACTRISSISCRSAPEATASGTRAAAARTNVGTPGKIGAPARTRPRKRSALAAMSARPGSMKTTFRPRLLNGQTGDPALLVSLRWQGRALLVDLGRIDRTPAATLLPIEAVFVSHTHMDHFMGFDQLLRLFLARDATLRLYGPAGLADCVAGKLAGYTWNLTDEYAFTLEVTEITARQTTSWRFAARQRFAREPLGPPRPFTGVVVADPVFRVEAAPLDHKIVSMAYAMTERTHLNVRPEALAAAGLEPGPWPNAP